MGVAPRTPPLGPSEDPRRLVRGTRPRGRGGLVPGRVQVAGPALPVGLGSPPGFCVTAYMSRRLGPLRAPDPLPGAVTLVSPRPLSVRGVSILAHTGYV